MTIEQALRWSREALLQHQIDDAPVEAEVLLKHALKLSRVQLYLDFARELTPEENEVFRGLVVRRLTGEPAAYITGCREFFGLEFYVDNRVLIPRPESELLVEQALRCVGEKPVSIADVGTGSGVLAVSLAVQLPSARIYAVDISPSALEVASINCRKHGVADRITLLQGNLLEPLPERVDMILANLPYVRQTELAAVNTYGFEPALALDGGSDGLERYRVLARQVSSRLNPGGHLLLEIGQGQQDDIIDLLRQHLPSGDIAMIPDFGGIPRVVAITLPG